MKRQLTMIGIAMSALLTFSPIQAQEIKERTIRFGHLQPLSHPQSAAIRHFAEVVAQKSNGKMRVREFPSSQLGNELQQQAALQSGTQEMMAGATTTLVGMVPEFGVLDFPFVISTYAQADGLLDGKLGQALFETLPNRGLIGLTYLENGFRNVTNSRGPIEKQENLAGLKIRVMQNPIYIEAFKTLGAVPVPLAFGELFTAMETRAVDAQENPFGIIISNKFYEVQKYLSITNHSYNTNVALVSKRFWDRLSDIEKQIIQEAAVEARDLQRKLGREQAQQAIEQLRNQGMTISTLSETELDRMRGATRSIVDSHAGKYDPAITQLFFEELDRLRQ